MDLKMVKDFLKADFNDDDTYIELLIRASQEYIVNAVGYFDERKALMEVLALNIISDMYEKRLYALSEDEKKSHITKSIVLQLQLTEPPEEATESE